MAAKKEEVLTVDVVQKKVSGMQEMVQKMEVKNEKDLEKVSDTIKQIKQLGKYIEQERDKNILPAKEIIKNEKAKYDPFIIECEKAESYLKGIAKNFILEEDEKRKAAELEIENKLEDGKIKEGTAVKRIEKLPEAVKSANTGNSALQTMKTKIVTIVDPNLVPDEYWMLDEVKIRKVAKAGVAIPGVEVKDDINLSSR